jgi:hypothetical protein
MDTSNGSHADEMCEPDLEAVVTNREYPERISAVIESV